MAKLIHPQAFLIAETRVDPDGMSDALEALGVPTWTTDAKDDASLLTEFAGKSCYMSFDTALNNNLTRTGTRNNHDYIQQGIIGNGHGSVLERGSRVIRSMLFEYTHIPAGATFEEVIVCNEYCVDRHGKQTHIRDRHPQLVWSDARAAC